MKGLIIYCGGPEEGGIPAFVTHYFPLTQYNSCKKQFSTWILHIVELKVA